MSSKANVASHAHLKLLLRGVPDSLDLAQCLQTLALKSAYTYYNPKQQTGWIALVPAPSEADLLPICQQLINATKALSIEKAPLQKIPRSQEPRRDQATNNIESDPHYLAFLESLGKDGTVKVAPKQTNADADNDGSVAPTAVAPIVTFLANRDKNSKCHSFQSPTGPDASIRADPIRRKKHRKKKEQKKPAAGVRPESAPPTASAPVHNNSQVKPANQLKPVKPANQLKPVKPANQLKLVKPVNQLKPVKPVEPVSSGVKILSKTNNQQTTARWQVKQSSSRSGPFGA